MSWASLSCPSRLLSNKANVFDKPNEQRLSMLRLCHGEKMKVKPTFSLSQMSRGWACSGYAMD